MRAVLTRAFSDPRATIGILQFADVGHDPIFTLEHPTLKIPAGVYTCKPYSSDKFKDVFEVTNVPGRTAILFHVGNFSEDTEGCILLGLESGTAYNNSNVGVFNSGKALELLRKLRPKLEFTLEIKG